MEGDIINIGPEFDWSQMDNDEYIQELAGATGTESFASMSNIDTSIDAQPRTQMCEEFFEWSITRFEELNNILELSRMFKNRDDSTAMTFGDDYTEMLKLLEFEKTLALALSPVVEDEDMDNVAAGSQLQMEERAVDGEENQSSDGVPVSEEYTLTHNNVVNPSEPPIVEADALNVLEIKSKSKDKVRPFECKEPGCERKFFMRPDLYDHILLRHTGILSEKRFLTGSDYYMHRLIHRKNYRFVCSTCLKRFFHSDALKNHQRIHSGEKPFDCPHCNMSCRQRGDRDKHVRTRHGHLNQNDLQLLQNKKMRLEAKEAAGCSSAALQDKETSTETSTAETPQQENINRYAKKDDMQDEKQKENGAILVVDSEDDEEKTI